MGLMVYAPHGRTGVYMLQDALQSLAPASEPPAARLDVARRVMRHLPDSAWLRANRGFADHLTGGDAGLYDLLLNPRDRAYDVASLHALLSGAGLSIAAFMEPARYDPALYLPDPKLRALAAALDPIARAGLAEALCGNISTHVVYVRRAAEVLALPDPLAESSVPLVRERSGAELAGAITANGTIGFSFDGLAMPVPLPRQAAQILRQIDGKRSVAEIAQALPGLEPAMFRRAFRETWERLNSFNSLLLAPPRL
jgi:hypothetical protein